MRKLTILLIFILNFGIRLSWDDRTVSIEVGTRCWAVDEEGDYEVPEGMHEQELEFDHEFTIKEPETGEETTVNTTITGSELYPDAIESSPPGFDVTPPELPDIDPDELDDLLDKIGPDIGSFDTESDTDLGGNPDIGPIVGPTTGDGGQEEEYEESEYSPGGGIVEEEVSPIPPKFPPPSEGLLFLPCSDCGAPFTPGHVCPPAEDCPELEPMNQDKKMNDSLKELAKTNENNPKNIEYGYTRDSKGNQADYTGETSRIKMDLPQGEKYTERAHTHPRGILAPSAGDIVAGLYRAVKNGNMKDMSSFRYLIATTNNGQNSYLNIQVSDLVLFLKFVDDWDGRKGISDRLKLIRESSKNNEQLESSVLKFFKENNSGLNFMRKVGDNTQWVAIAVNEKGDIINKNCN